MSYEIKTATIADLPRILEIYAEAREFMRQSGNPNQWWDYHPAENILRQDIAVEKLYLCMENSEIMGVFYYEQGIDPTYVNIEDGSWLNEEPYGVIHRIAAAHRGKGVAGFCFDWALKQCPSLRIDTHQDNAAMQNALNKHGFVRCGIIRIFNGDQRIAYHKTT